MRNLKTEQEIMRNWKGNPVNPLVSICCITYNHEHYIEDAIESFLIQETDFPIEILIHDDASVDKTTEIIFQYESKYPNLIKPIYQKENQWSQGKQVAWINTERAKGKYIALCEGDDYWTMTDKLKKQVTFLENNSEYSMCFHNAIVINQITSKNNLFANLEEREYSGEEILETWLIPTASVMYRSKFRYKTPNFSYYYGDIFLWLNLAEMGKLYNLNDTMSIYRNHPTSLRNIANVEKMISLANQYKSMDDYFNKKFSETLQKKVSDKYFCAFSLCIKNKKKILCFKYLSMAFVSSPKAFFNIILKRFKKHISVALHRDHLTGC